MVVIRLSSCLFNVQAEAKRHNDVLGLRGVYIILKQALGVNLWDRSRRRVEGTKVGRSRVVCVSHGKRLTSRYGILISTTTGNNIDKA